MCGKLQSVCYVHIFKSWVCKCCMSRKAEETKQKAALSVVWKGQSKEGFCK